MTTCITRLLTFSNAFWMQSFLPAQKSTQQSVNFDLKKQNRETMSACITYTICDPKNVLMMHIFPMILKFPFSQVKISLLIFAIRSLQFSLTWDVHWWLQNYTPRIRIQVFQQKSNSFSVHFFLLPNHIASHFIHLYVNPWTEKRHWTFPVHNTCLARPSKIKLYRQRAVKFFYNFFRIHNINSFNLFTLSIFIASNSTASIKASGENGQPWRIPDST